MSLMWLREFLKPINIKKKKSVSKAEITSFLLVCVPLELTKRKRKRMLNLVLSTQALMGEVQFNVFISPIYEHKIYNFFINKVVANSSLFIDYDSMLKNNDHQRNFRENFKLKMK